MLVRYGIAVALAGLVSTAALAEPITATDGSGTVYQLNDDGTWNIVVTTGDGKTLLLAPDGHWWDSDEVTALTQRFAAVLDDTFAKGDVPKPDDGDWPKYRSCLMTLFDSMPVGARRILVTNSPRESFKKLEAAFPDAAKQLNDGDKACRKGIDFSKK